MNVIHITIMTSTLIHIVTLGLASFVLSMLLTPIYTTYAYKHEWWKKLRSEGMGGVATPVYKKLHAAKHKRNIPTMAGIVFVVSAAIVTLVANLSRGETWLPLAGMVTAGAIGLIDDYMNIRSGGKGVAGMKAKLKFLLYSAIAFAGGWWFFSKLGVNSIYLPVIHHWHVGIFIILIFWLVVVATANAVNMTDGLDGLAGGLLVSSFTVYTLIAGAEGKYALAAFCLTIVGALLSYTWFNIAPARFFMGDVGAFALGTALGVIAMQTDTVYVLPIIGLVYVMEAGSVIINRTSRKLRHGKKVFLSSPLHHHFEAIGWPETKVTMRFWILGQVAAIAGLVVFLLGRYG
ncbi:MAG TPA: phospho-N-acetylmuramoyl-pentapeptide-transferase [Candidatus Saccharimonadales bacterium]|nr:phospho-N-acetylmuramoyl-pentapeptide-transferase [Candidatus Saccharimonadales bacterium]